MKIINKEDTQRFLEQIEWQLQKETYERLKSCIGYPKLQRHPSIYACCKKLVQHIITNTSRAYQFYWTITLLVEKLVHPSFFSEVNFIKGYNDATVRLYKTGELNINIGIGKRCYIGSEEWCSWGHELGHLICRPLYWARPRGKHDEEIEKQLLLFDYEKEGIYMYEEKVCDEISLFLLEHCFNRVGEVEDYGKWKEYIANIVDDDFCLLSV